ncbi:MAG: DUF2179 domain-containing protein [Clostridia bacterium]|nr:DUF2179 domain-containing protein [Clostridia bacterium]
MFFGVEVDLWFVCIIVVLGRIVDMGLATIRTVFVVKGKSGLAATLGFVEAFFWFVVVKAALDFNISLSPVVGTFLIATVYSLGFALGTYLGGLFSKRFIKVNVKVQIVLSNKNDEVVEELQNNGFGATILTAKGAKEKHETYLIFVETDSKNLAKLKQIIDKKDPRAFISVNESRNVYNGYFVRNVK